MPLIEIRIALDLFLHGAGRAVTGQQARLGRQAEDVMINALQQLLAVATGQVGATDAVQEDQITGQHGVGLGRVEDDMPWGVSRRMAHLDLLVANIQQLAVLEENDRLRQLDHIDAKS